MWHLLLKGPGQPDTPHALPEGTTRVGRSEDNELVLEGERVSRHHARLHVEGALREAVQVETEPAGGR